jgi:hypothetical protein
MLAWNLTRLYLGDYYRTYPITVEDEVTAALARPEDFQHGPTPMTRDAPERLTGFAVVDRNYVSARWPGDAHQFAFSLAALLAPPSGKEARSHRWLAALNPDIRTTGRQPATKTDASNVS